MTEIETSCSRPAARVEIDPDCLLALLQPGVYFVEGENALPAKARVVSAYYSEERHRFGLVLEHESFELCNHGDFLPLLPGPLIKRRCVPKEQTDDHGNKSSAPESGLPDRF